MMKICLLCKETKPLTEFYHHKSSGRSQSRFKLCQNLKSKEWSNVLSDIAPFISAKHTHIDHCHDSKVVRGILCSHCNLGIGHLKESRAIMERAIAYFYPVSHH